MAGVCCVGGADQRSLLGLIGRGGGRLTSEDLSPETLHRDYIAIAGPTASGKSSLALELARVMGGEIINCDSVQLYKGFDIGSAKPSLDEQKLCPHHLIDELDWSDPYDARRFSSQAAALLQEVRARGAVPIIVGGTGLYLRALWQQNFDDLPKSESLRQQLQKCSTSDLLRRLIELDPKRAEQLHPNDRFRICRSLEVVELTKKPFPQPKPSAYQASSIRRRCLAVKLEVDRAQLHQRIAVRTQQMLANGLIEEVQGLLEGGVAPDCKVMQSIGYREVVAMLQGKLPANELQEAITIATRQYAKRQETWFRRVDFDLYLNPASSSHEIMQAMGRLPSDS